jgi:D-3-phosphoglycerate dehydrogenase
MSELKILISDGLETKGQTILRAAAQVDDIPNISASQLLDAIAAYDALIVRSRTKVTPAVLAAAPRLRVVGRAGVGVDNIDLQAAQARGVLVVNAPTATTISVAEQTLGLMFALARRIPWADAAVKRGDWPKKDLMGVELNGKTLGVIGFGNIGRTVVQRARCLGMHVLVNSLAVTPDEVRQEGAELVDLFELFDQADFITLHVPLNDTTRNLIGAAALAQMKPGVRLICTARGGIVDESALLEALNSGQVAGAALDVFAQEPTGASPLITHSNVIATPHVSGQTADAQERVAEDIAVEVLKALCGEPLRWRVV